VTIAIISHEITVLQTNQNEPLPTQQQQQQQQQHQQQQEPTHSRWVQDFIQNWTSGSLQHIIDQIVQAQLLNYEPPPRHTSKEFIQTLPVVPIHTIERGEKCPVCFEEFRMTNNNNENNNKTNDSYRETQNLIHTSMQSSLTDVSTPSNNVNTEERNSISSDQIFVSTPMYVLSPLSITHFTKETILIV
jgi:hypothetical protein